MTKPKSIEQIKQDLGALHDRLEGIPESCAVVDLVEIVATIVLRIEELEGSTKRASDLAGMLANGIKPD